MVRPIGRMRAGPAMQWMANRFELSRNDGSGNVRPMEGLRGFAVFLVFLVHYATLMTPWMPMSSAIASAAKAIHMIGNAGVDLFFVLSGYLIYGSLMSRQQAFLPFMRRRVARIYPAFLVVFAIYLLLSFVQPGASKIPHGAAAACLYIVENLLLLPGIFPIDPIITVAWTLSYEMLYYLVLPPLLLLLGMRTRSSTWRCGFFSVAGLVILVACAVYIGPIRLVMFIAGILLSEAMRAKIAAPRAGVVLAVVLATFLFATTPYVDPVAWVAKTLTLFCAFFLLCQHCFSLPQSWLARAFSLAPVRWLGNMSYSYYLLHGLALKVIVQVLYAVVPTVRHETAFILAALMPIFFLTLLPAAALFLLVERPLSLNQRGRVHAATAPAIN